MRCGWDEGHTWGPCLKQASARPTPPDNPHFPAQLERDHAQIIGRPEVAGAETLIAHLKLEGVTPGQFLKVREVEAVRWLAAPPPLCTPLSSSFQARDEKFKELIGDVQALPGAVQLLRWLKEELHLPVAVATSSSREYLPLKQAKNAELFSFVDAVVCGDDDVVGAGKPAPDIFLAGAKALHLPPTSCISVEDAISGVKAATSAGMWTACVPHPSVPVQQYVEAGADLISPGGLLPVLSWLKAALEAQVKSSGGQGE